jgi:hypothetical protein
MINGLPFQRSWAGRCQIKESLLPVTEVCAASRASPRRRTASGRVIADEAIGATSMNEVVAHIVGAA